MMSMKLNVTPIYDYVQSVLKAFIPTFLFKNSLT